MDEQLNAGTHTKSGKSLMNFMNAFLRARTAFEIKEEGFLQALLPVWAILRSVFISGELCAHHFHKKIIGAGNFA